MKKKTKKTRKKKSEAGSFAELVRSKKTGHVTLVVRGISQDDTFDPKFSTIDRKNPRKVVVFEVSPPDGIALAAALVRVFLPHAVSCGDCEGALSEMVYDILDTLVLNVDDVDDKPGLDKPAGESTLN